jgi:crossover junction endodeoxyribonuclease RusA
MITLKLPWPPTLNHYYVAIKGRKVLSKGGRDYHEVVRRLCVDGLGWPKAGPYWNGQRIELTMMLYSPDKRKYDIDNRIKAVQDALTKSGVWTDDSQIDQLHVIRGGVDREDAHVMVMIREIGNDRRD